MIIEKIVKFAGAPAEIITALREGWEKEGFSCRPLEEGELEIRCQGFVYSRVRVDVSTQCFDYAWGSLVQVIYSPLLTPSSLRPLNLSSAGRQRVLEDLDKKFTAVLNHAGNWKAVSRETVDDTDIALQDPFNIYYRSPRRSAKRRILVGLVMTVLGSLMSYLHSSDILTLGSLNFWLILALLGVLLLCLGLFNMIWRN